MVNRAAFRFALVAAFGIACACRKPTLSAVERLKPCAITEGPTDAFCGKVGVWENRASKAGRKIALNVVVLPALRRDSKPDPIFVFAGGPGQGAAKAAQLFAPMFRRLQNDRDIVLIDQRGTGESNPLGCKPPDSDDLTKLDDVSLDFFKKCLEKYDADPKLYTTSIAMDDIEDARVHLGYGRINLWGGSYGTRAAMVYLRQHPDSVRTVVLDGVAPVDMRLPLFMSRDSQRALDLLIRDCEKDKACLARFPDLKKKVDAILSYAATKPRIRIVHPRTGERTEAILTRSLVASILFGALYSPTVSSLLPSLIEDAAAGDYQGLFALAFGNERLAETISPGMFLSVVCAEDMPRIAGDDITAETRNTFYGTTMFETRMKACEFWPRGEVDPAFYQAVSSAVPVLIFSGELDPVTPPVWGQAVARHLANSRHIVVPGAGHGTTASGCVPKLTSQFLDRADAKQLDDSCLRQLRRPPFFVNHSGPTGAARR